MTDSKRQGQFQSQTSIISLDNCKYDQFMSLIKTNSLNDQLEILDQRSSFCFKENSQVNMVTSFQPNHPKTIKRSNDMSKRNSQESTQIIKKAQSFQTQNIQVMTTLSKFFNQNKEQSLKIKIFSQDRACKNNNIQIKQIENTIMSVQNEYEQNLEENKQCFQFDLSKQESRIIQIKQEKVCKQSKIDQMKDMCKIGLVSQKKIKNRDLSNKQNYFEDAIQRKQTKTKSMKKVAFQHLNIDSPKQDPKTCKNFIKTSIRVDQTGSQASRSSFFQTKNSKYSKGSVRHMSQIGSFRMIKVVGPKQHTYQLMLKEVQIKNEEIQRKQQQLYKISHQNKHPNILRMYSKNKVFRDNKIYLQIKMQVYETNLVNYLIQNEQSPLMAIERKIILFQIIKGLNFLHSKKIYHRDLNPFNIMIAEKLKVSLTNFAFVQNPQTTQFSQKNYYECNSFIRPPQIILNPLRPFDKGGDVWALGCIIVYMLKGDMPFIDYSDADLILQMMKFLGKPSRQFLQSIDFKCNRRFNFPQQPLLSMKDFFHCNDNSLFDLLQSIFKFQSQKRQSTQNLLASRYFDELRDQVRFDILEKDYNIGSLFDFSNHALEKHKKARIVPERYHKK